ncbi:MAG TPA: UDP-N-acetylglucosamine 1-carboxyvinyltransferase, partial [Acidimicrobiales bacterium]|nr:UDP-N-acetylglucosamine 1-carboxyvinyltransferase [Acidimicrobiales bacterium]
MDRFVVRPGGALSGTVQVYGAKNSVLKLMAASLLSPGHHHLANVPDIVDVSIMADILAAMGAAAEHSGSGTDGVLDIVVPETITPVAPYELVEKMRASIVVLGPLLARYGRARVSLPGGDDFGARPIDFHLRAFEDLGVVFTTDHGYIEGRCDRLVGTRIVLEFPSHTATDNVLMAAVLAKGTTVLENAAREP